MSMQSYGFDGSVGEVEWASLLPLAGGADYGVLGAGDWRVTPVSAADRTVSVAPGTGFGRGVLDLGDVTDTAVTLQGGLVASGSRWDTVVRRRDRQPPSGTSTFVLLPGTSAQAISSQRIAPGGLVDDQPLALVQFTAGQTMPTQIIDLRCWHGNSGLYASRLEALHYLDRVGTRVYVEETRTDYVRRLDAQQNPVWDAAAPGSWTPQSAGQASTSNVVIPNNGTLGLTKAITLEASDQFRMADLTFGALPLSVASGASLEVFVRASGTAFGTDLPRRLRTRSSNESVTGSYSLPLIPNVAPTFQLVGTAAGGSVSVTPDSRFTYLDVNIRGS